MGASRRDQLTMRAWASLKGATWDIFGRIKADAPEGGATPGHMGFLHALVAANHPLTPGELAGRLAVTPATVTGALTTLEDLGLVERTRGQEDRRAVLVIITPRGRDVSRKWALKIHEHLRTALAPLTEAELEVIAGLLARVAPPIQGPPRDMMTSLRHDVPETPAKRRRAR